MLKKNHHRNLKDFSGLLGERGGGRNQKAPLEILLQWQVKRYTLERTKKNVMLIFMAHVGTAPREGCLASQCLLDMNSFPLLGMKPLLLFFMCSSCTPYINQQTRWFSLDHVWGMYNLEWLFKKKKSPNLILKETKPSFRAHSRGQ